MRKRTNKLPIAILDRRMCLRIQPGDEREASVSVPFYCKACKENGTYSGKLWFSGDNFPECEDHDNPIAMITRI